jgi:3-oxoadipyl-CoA thiolase
MREALIVDACRTPIGRYGGALAGVRPDDLAAAVIRALIDRTGIDPAGIEDVVFGCANQAGEDNRNVARMAALLAGLPVTVPGQTVNRLCGSGLQAVITASQAIRAGAGDAFVAGGVESMSRAPWVVLKPDQRFPRGIPDVADSLLGWRFVNPRMSREWTVPLGETAEIVADEWSVSRADQDAFALRSQYLAAAASDSGRFRAEIVPVAVPRPGAEPMLVEEDEHPRPDSSLTALAALPPAFRSERGTVTAGNSSGLNDGAAAMLIVSSEALDQTSAQPLARVVSSAVAGVDPHRMGIGPVPAVRKALERARITVPELELIELNEAFAAQAVACVRELEIDPTIVNVNGGAIALGHPLGASGARMVTTLVHEMKRREARYGLAAMCIGVGQGLAVVLERADRHDG